MDVLLVASTDVSSKRSGVERGRSLVLCRFGSCDGSTAPQSFVLSDPANSGVDSESGCKLMLKGTLDFTRRTSCKSHQVLTVRGREKGAEYALSVNLSLSHKNIEGTCVYLSKG
eukprot:m.6335 g.6335  ORF g.6335 m.6335 type:complete len:114 (-) comp5145_c0_seq2:168-509(-)